MIRVDGAAARVRIASPHFSRFGKDARGSASEDRFWTILSLSADFYSLFALVGRALRARCGRLGEPSLPLKTLTSILSPQAGRGGVTRRRFPISLSDFARQLRRPIMALTTLGLRSRLNTTRMRFAYPLDLSAFWERRTRQRQ